MLLDNKDIPDVLRYVVGFDQLDLFGMYYILDNSKAGQKYSILTAEEAATVLTIGDYNTLRDMLSQYLINVSIRIPHIILSFVVLT